MSTFRSTSSKHFSSSMIRWISSSFTNPLELTALAISLISSPKTLISSFTFFRKPSGYGFKFDVRIMCRIYSLGVFPLTSSFVRANAMLASAAVYITAITHLTEKELGHPSPLPSTFPEGPSLDHFWPTWPEADFP